MVALFQSENHAANKGKTAGRNQFDTHPTGIGLRCVITIYIRKVLNLIADNSYVFKTRRKPDLIKSSVHFLHN